MGDCSHRPYLQGRICWSSLGARTSIESLRDTGEEAVSTFPSCYESENVICKHVRADITVYVNLDARLAAGQTVISATAESADEELLLGNPSIISSDTVIEENSSCGGVTLKAGRAISFSIENGTPDDESETIVVVGFVSSDGQHDYVDCRLLIGGTPGFG